ncbi:MAG: porin [Hydrogenophaga sp.]
MKKTLIALAAVAATGAAFAQSTVTLSGKYAFAYTATDTDNAAIAGGTKTNGFGTTDGDVVFAAVEDLGGGLKASADMALRLRGRGDANGRDAKIALSGGFGRLVGGTIEAGNGIIGRASAGAPTIGLDNKIGLDAPANVDWLAYYTPAMNGFVASVQIVDSVGTPAAGGLQNAALTLDGTVVGVTYDAGPLSVGADYTSFGKNSAVPTAPALGVTKSRVRVSASYNLGVATVGAGYQTKDNTAGGADNEQWMLGVSAPLGAITVGATMAHHDGGNGFGLDGVEVKSYELGANYAFSKRTSLQAAYQSMDVDVNGAHGSKDTAFRVRLMHAF